MQGRMELVAGKVEKERVNTCSKEMYSIKAEIYKYRAKDRRNIESLGEKIKQELKVLNSTFGMLKSQSI